MAVIKKSKKFSKVSKKKTMKRQNMKRKNMIGGVKPPSQAQIRAIALVQAKAAEAQKRQNSFNEALIKKGYGPEVRYLKSQQSADPIKTTAMGPIKNTKFDPGAAAKLSSGMSSFKYKPQ